MSRVLDSCKKVAELSDIKIDLNCAQVLAKQIYDEIVNDRLSCQNFSNESVHPTEKNERTINWIFTVDTLNYCFWSPENKHWIVKWRGEEYTGYFALCAAVNRAIDEGFDIIDPKVSEILTYHDFCHILRGDNGTELLLMKERYECLLESAQVLNKKFAGSFVNCIIQCDKSAQKLLDIIVNNFSKFRDEAKYEDFDVYIYKRAQIVIGDIFQSFEGKTYGEFYDIDTITMFADYRVPQVLSYFGVLQYPDQLLKLLVDSHSFGKTIANGSKEEVELRATSVVAVDKINELVRELLNNNNQTTKICNPILIDQYLWTYRRRNSEHLECIPYHKTITIYY